MCGGRESIVKSVFAEGEARGTVSAGGSGIKAMEGGICRQTAAGRRDPDLFRQPADGEAEGGALRGWTSFRDGPKDQTRNLEILRCAIAHRSSRLRRAPE